MATIDLTEAELARLDDLLSALDDPEDIDLVVHSTRKGIKRLRAHLRLAQGAIDPAVYRAENAELRDTGRLLAPARDALVNRLTLEALEPGPGWEAAADYAAAHHRAQIDELRSGPLSGIRHRLEGIHQRWPGHSAPLDRGVISAGLARTFAGGKENLEAALVSPQAREFHQWRKQVKYLRYQLEAIEAGPAVVEPFHELGETLGLEHDHTVFIDFVDDHIDMTPDRRDRYVLIDRAEGRREELRALALKTDLYAEEPQAFGAGVLGA